VQYIIPKNNASIAFYTAYLAHLSKKYVQAFTLLYCDHGQGKLKH